MATQAQILANRSNARKSTGPRTAEGKAVVAQNAVKHGFCGREVLISGEDPGQFESYRERMLAELDPVGEVEADLAERIVGLSWRLKRADRLQATAFDSLYARQKHSPMEQYDKVQDADGGSTFGRALVRDFGDARVIDRLSMYERRIEHSLYRTMAELKRHRILQEVGPGGMWELRRTLASDDAGRESHGRDARATVAADGPVNAPEGGASGNEAGRSAVVGGRTNAESGESARSVPVRAYPRVAGILPAIRGRDALDTMTPDGATMNKDGRDARAATPPAGGPANTLEGVQGADSSLHTSNIKLPTSPDPSCKTKPISPVSDDGQVACDEELTAASRCDESDETKPISDTVLSLKRAAAPGIPLCEAPGQNCDHPAEALCQMARLQ